MLTRQATTFSINVTLTMKEGCREMLG